MNRFWNAMLRFTIVRSGTVTWMSAGFAALILMTAFAVAGFFYRQRGSDAVRHTFEVDGRLARILSALQDAETRQRGSVISGDDAFLAPFLAGHAAFAAAGEGAGRWREVSRAPLRGRTEAMGSLTPAEPEAPARATSLSIETTGGRLYPVGT